MISPGVKQGGLAASTEIKKQKTKRSGTKHKGFDKADNYQSTLQTVSVSYSIWRLIMASPAWLHTNHLSELCCAVVTCCVRMFFSPHIWFWFIFWRGLAINQHSSPCCHNDTFLPQELAMSHLDIKTDILSIDCSETISAAQLKCRWTLPKEANWHFPLLAPQYC